MKMICDAKDCVARIPSKVLEEGTGIPWIIFLERDTTARGLTDVRGTQANISYTEIVGTSTCSRYSQIEMPLEGLSDGCMRRKQLDSRDTGALRANLQSNIVENVRIGR